IRAIRGLPSRVLDAAGCLCPIFFCRPCKKFFCCEVRHVDPRGPYADIRRCDGDCGCSAARPGEEAARRPATKAAAEKTRAEAPACGAPMSPARGALSGPRRPAMVAPMSEPANLPATTPAKPPKPDRRRLLKPTLREAIVLMTWGDDKGEVLDHM